MIARETINVINCHFYFDDFKLCLSNW